MPKVNLSKYSDKEYPPIDWLWAAILERQIVYGYTLEKMADIAGVHYGTMRRYIRMSPWRWHPDARDRICQEFKIKPQVSVRPTEAEGKVKR